MKVDLVLPGWVGTVAGVVVIGLSALTAIAIAQARAIDIMHARLLAAESRAAEAQVDHNTVENLEAQLACLTKQQDMLTAATRGGWGQAHRLMRAGALETCYETKTSQNEASR